MYPLFYDERHDAMICGNGPCGRSSAFAWRQSRHCCRGPLFTIRKPARPALRLGQAGTLQQHPGRAAPPLYPRYETAFRGRQLSLTQGVGSAAGRSPHRRAKPRRPAAAARFVGPPGRALRPTPARPRAPLTAVGGKARANDRGLARKKEAGQTTLRLSSGRLPQKSLKRGYRHF